MKKQSNFKVIIKQSQTPLIIRLVGIEVLFLLLIFLLANVLSTLFYPSNFYSILKVFIILLLTLSNVILVSMTVIDWLGKKYVVRKNDITIHKGFFTNSRKVVKSAHIASVELQQNIFEKMLNYGTIKIYSPMFNKVLYLRDATQPKQVVTHLREVFGGKNANKMIVRS